MERTGQLLRTIIPVLILAGLIFSPSALAEEEAQIHIVQPGETLLGLALRYGTTTESLAKANDLRDPNFIRAGQRLTIAKAASPSPSPKPSPTVHTIMAGETLSHIAYKYGVSLQELAAANQLKDLNWIVAGMKLAIPGSGATPPSPKASSYQVQPGDTLSKIALEHSVSVQALAAANNIPDPNRLRAGQVLAIPASNEPPAKTAATPPATKAQPAVSGQEIANLGLSFIGTPYLWGGNTPAGFDCSGLVQYVLGRFGINVPHDVISLYNMSKKVPRPELRPGDLVFFKDTYIPGLSHVGIYIGQDKFVHAPYGGKAVDTNSLGEKYYADRFVGGGRIP